MKGSPPLRFLALAVGGWVCVRGAVLILPGWMVPVAAAPSEVRPAPMAAQAIPTSTTPRVTPAAAEPVALRVPKTRTAANRPVVAPLRIALLPPAVLPERALLARASQAWHQAPLLETPERVAISRWSASAWAFARRGEGAALAAGGTLGGSQIGARLTYRLNGDAARPLALSARLYAPARQARAAEVALGVEWQPSARLPVRILAERRQALGRDGRSAFALMAHGGVSDLGLPRGLRLDAYAQSGIVGLQSRDLFADGSARVSLPVGEAGRVKLGLGAWGAAQPGVARLDLGPQASLRLPAAGGSVTLAVDWRIRAAGNARPGSGPSLTLSTGF